MYVGGALAILYVSDNSKVIYNQRIPYQYITSMDK